MQLDPKKIKKLAVVSALKDPSQVVLLQHIDSVEEKFDISIDALTRKVEAIKTPDLTAVLEQIKGAPGEDGYTPLKDVDYFDGQKGDAGKDYVLTPQDKSEIALQVKVPIVEKIIETIVKTETIKEIPIVTEKITNEIKEVAITENPEQIVGKVNLSKKKIKQSQIDGLEDIKNMAIANSVPITTSFFNGLRAKNLTIIGGTAKQVGDTVQVTVTSGTGTVNSVVAGTGISVNNTDPANPIVSATGSGSSLQKPTGIIDGVNTSFTAATAPTLVLTEQGNSVNGFGCTIVGTAITMTIAPQQFIYCL